MTKYSEKLKDPKWQKKRLEILERDGWRCRECGNSKTTLHIHHKTHKYGKHPWEYQDDNFITLCENCHESKKLNPTPKPTIADRLGRLKVERRSALGRLNTHPEAAILIISELDRLIKKLESKNAEMVM